MILDALIWLDIKLFWLFTLGRAKPGETASAAAWSTYLAGKWQGRFFVPLIDGLAEFFGDKPNHCQRAYQWQIHLYKGTP